MRQAFLIVVAIAGSCAPQTRPPDLGFRPCAIIVHSTSGLDLHEAKTAMRRLGLAVHVLIDRDGTVHPLIPFEGPARAARGMDEIALHVSVVGGVGAELLSEPALLDSAARLIRSLAERHAIPRSNDDVISGRGIFSHQQVKYRFGGLRRGEEKGRMEPGEDFMKALLNRVGGTYVEEKHWADRSKDGWVCVWEGGNLGVRGELTKGRGLTRAPAPPEPPLEMAEERRLRYVDRGPMKEVRGVVLHFTATKTWKEAVDTFERRRLGPSIIVETDGRAWQVVDRLEDKVAAAAGTNDHCIQIEIVGENEDALLANEVQLKGVVSVVRSLGRRIPLNNRDIDSLRGVFSHG
ncbi:MAG TPA: peptidoglycan recognition family protein, partial [Planctomycetota bacterium]|nr:peptidoglycan recognition family protein [Planctomycetota bacterium]